jgi:hypothetical protein
MAKMRGTNYGTDTVYVPTNLHDVLELRVENYSQFVYTIDGVEAFGWFTSREAFLRVLAVWNRRGRKVYAEVARG